MVQSITSDVFPNDTCISLENKQAQDAQDGQARLPPRPRTGRPGC